MMSWKDEESLRLEMERRATDIKQVRYLLENAKESVMFPSFLKVCIQIHFLELENGNGKNIKIFRNFFPSLSLSFFFFVSLERW